MVTRVTGLMRSALMMGAMIPLSINTMSVFSFSGKLCKQGNFIHPGYQMDDIIALIRWMGSLGRQVTPLTNTDPILVTSGGCR